MRTCCISHMGAESDWLFEVRLRWLLNTQTDKQNSSAGYCMELVILIRTISINNSVRIYCIITISYYRINEFNGHKYSILYSFTGHFSNDRMELALTSESVGNLHLSMMPNSLIDHHLLLEDVERMFLHQGRLLARWPPPLFTVPPYLSDHFMCLEHLDYIRWELYFSKGCCKCTQEALRTDRNLMAWWSEAHFNQMLNCTVQCKCISLSLSVSLSASHIL